MYSNSDCPSLAPLIVRDDLAGDELERVTRHLTSCQACREAAELLRLDLILPALESGAVVENYRVERCIGIGGTSSVFAAVHVAVKRRVAIKVMHDQLVRSSDARARFARDAALVAQLRGEHVCRLYSFGELPSGQPYMLLELLEGEDLLARLERARLAPSEAIECVVQACVGLAEAHTRGIVHRDIKPANLFATTSADGSPLIKLLDFGVAKLPAAQTITRTGVNVGSVPYMSPEQLRSSKKVDVRSDVWSLGITLHQLVTGELPFPATTAADTAIRIWTDEPPVMQGTIGSVIARCLAKQPEARYADVAELAAALGADPARVARLGRILRR